MIANDERWLAGVVVVDKTDYPETTSVNGEVVLKGREPDSIHSLFVVGKWRRVGSGCCYFESFGRWAGLHLVVLPPGLVKIGSLSFCNCSSLCRIAIPDTVKVIGGFAFDGSGLVEIDLPEEMESIGEGAFSGCRNLKRIRLPRKLGSLGGSALRSAPLLVDVELPVELGTAGGNILSKVERLTVWNISSWEKYTFALCVVEELIFRGDDIRVLEMSVWRSVKRIRSTKFAGRVVLGIMVESE
jgi:hypothetical protein